VAREAVPYKLVEQADGLTMQLKDAVLEEEDAFHSNSPEILDRIELTLRNDRIREKTTSS